MTRLSELMHTVCNHASWDLTQIILKHQFRSLTFNRSSLCFLCWYIQSSTHRDFISMGTLLERFSYPAFWAELKLGWIFCGGDLLTHEWGETLLYWQWACDFSSLTLPNITSFPLMPCICVMASTASLWGKLISVFLTWTEQRDNYLHRNKAIINHIYYLHEISFPPFPFSSSSSYLSFFNFLFQACFFFFFSCFPFS